MVLPQMGIIQQTNTERAVGTDPRFVSVYQLESATAYYHKKGKPHLKEINRTVISKMILPL